MKGSRDLKARYWQNHKLPAGDFELGGQPRHHGNPNPCGNRTPMASVLPRDIATETRTPAFLQGVLDDLAGPGAFSPKKKRHRFEVAWHKTGACRQRVTGP